MITPKFKVDQDDQTVTVTIFTPFARISDAEINIDGDSFTFYSSPYYLRLNMPGRLIDSELEKHRAIYDTDLGAFVVVGQKETAGQIFEGLDMLTKLLQPPGADGVTKPLIEVIGDEKQDSSSDDGGDDEDIDWFYEQKLNEDLIISTGHKYGFANTHTGVFTALKSELHGVVDISDPDNKSPALRRDERHAQELSKFDDNHYLADLFEDDVARQCIHFIPEFYSVTREEVTLSEEEQEALLRLPRKEHLIDKSNRSMVYFGLVDLIFSWSYNHRVTQGENCAESAWNMAKQSATLSWLDSFTDIRDVLVSCYRRSLIFPLVRNWQLAQAVLKDTVKILLLGRKQVLKCLLEIQRQLNASESYYILNQLYVTDYCVWIQRVKEQRLFSLADSIRKVKLNKDDVGLELVELEAAGNLVLEEGEDNDNVDQPFNINDIMDHFGNLTIIENGAATNDNSQSPKVTVVSRRSKQHSIIVRDSDSSSSEDSETDSSDDDSSDDSSDSSTDDSSSSSSSSDSSELDSDDDEEQPRYQETPI